MLEARYRSLLKSEDLNGIISIKYCIVVYYLHYIYIVIIITNHHIEVTYLMQIQSDMRQPK